MFVASETLLATKAALNPRTYHSPHGVDVEHFAMANRSGGRIPDDIKTLPHPIIGFHGLIERWIDLDLVAYLARQRPEWSFLMIGRVAVPVAEVPQLPNLPFRGSPAVRTAAGIWAAHGRSNHSVSAEPAGAACEPVETQGIPRDGKADRICVRTCETEKFADVSGWPMGRSSSSLSSTKR